MLTHGNDDIDAAASPNSAARRKQPHVSRLAHAPAAAKHALEGNGVHVPEKLDAPSARTKAEPGKLAHANTRPDAWPAESQVRGTQAHATAKVDAPDENQSGCGKPPDVANSGDAATAETDGQGNELDGYATFHALLAEPTATAQESTATKCPAPSRRTSRRASLHTPQDGETPCGTETVDGAANATQPRRPTPHPRSKRERGRANAVASLTTPTPSALTESPAGNAAMTLASTGRPAPRPRPDLCSLLRTHARTRKNILTSQRQLTLRIGSYIRTNLGWRLDLPADVREAINKQAAQVADELEAAFTAARKSGGIPLPPTSGAAPLETYAMVAPFVFASFLAREPFDVMRHNVEAEMSAAASELPVCEWWCSHRGCAPFGLALIVGEAGDFSRFTKGYGGLKKWLGLAPRRCYDVATKSGKLAQKFPGHVYASLFVIAGVQIRGKGYYEPVYRAERERLAQVDPDGERHHRRAIRKMLDVMLFELYERWMGAEGNFPAVAGKSHAPAPSGE